jgi:hypothetical protein
MIINYLNVIFNVRITQARSWRTQQASRRDSLGKPRASAVSEARRAALGRRRLRCLESCKDALREPSSFRRPSRCPWPARYSSPSFQDGDPCAALYPGLRAPAWPARLPWAFQVGPFRSRADVPVASNEARNRRLSCAVLSPSDFLYPLIPVPCILTLPPHSATHPIVTRCNSMSLSVCLGFSWRGIVACGHSSIRFARPDCRYVVRFTSVRRPTGWT